MSRLKREGVKAMVFFSRAMGKRGGEVEVEVVCVWAWRVRREDNEEQDWMASDRGQGSGCFFSLRVSMTSFFDFCNPKLNKLFSWVTRAEVKIRRLFSVCSGKPLCLFPILIRTAGASPSSMISNSWTRTVRTFCTSPRVAGDK